MASDWTRVSEYAITRPGQTIAKTGRECVDLQYDLYGAGPRMIGHWPTAKEAMEAADLARKEEKAGGPGAEGINQRIKDRAEQDRQDKEKSP